MTINKLTKRNRVIAVVLIVGLFIVGSTLAYLSHITETKVNAFSSNGRVNVAVIEDDGGGKSVTGETGEGLELPAITASGVTKKVAIKNLDKAEYPTTDTYVRVRLVPSFVYTRGAHKDETVAVDLTSKVSYEIASDNHWTAQTAKNGETYYYYNKILVPGATSDLLFSKVSYNGEIPSDAMFVLEVLVDGVSANSSGVMNRSAVEAWGLNDGSMWDVTNINWNDILTNDKKNI